MAVVVRRGKATLVEPLYRIVSFSLTFWARVDLTPYLATSPTYIVTAEGSCVGRFSTVLRITTRPPLQADMHSYLLPWWLYMAVDCRRTTGFHSAPSNLHHLPAFNVFVINLICLLHLLTLSFFFFWNNFFQHSFPPQHL